MMATGGAFAGRALYSNDESSVIHVQRPIILSGIEEFVRRADLSDRTVYLNLPPIDDARRRREDQFWPAFHQERPKILGGLLDAVAGGLRHLPAIDFPKLPRMADFAAFGEAVGHSLGWPAGTLLADYYANRHEASAAQLEDSSVATVLLGLGHRLDHWTGTPTALLNTLTRLAPRRLTQSAAWPKSPSWFTNEVRRLAPQLRIHGISVAFSRNPRGRVLSITKLYGLKDENVDMRNII